MIYYHIYIYDLLCICIRMHVYMYVWMNNRHLLLQKYTYSYGVVIRITTFFLEGFRFLTLSWKLGSIPTPTDPVWQFVKMVHNLHLMLVPAKDMFPEIFQTQLSSFNSMIYSFTPYFSATPPVCIVASTELWLTTLYSWRNWDTLFLEI